MQKIKKDWLKQPKASFVEPTLTAFQCNACGKAMPIQSSNTQKCTSCGEPNILPEPYKQLRDNKLRHENTLKEQRELYKRISQKPSRFLVVWTSISDAIIGVIGIFLVALSFITGAAGLVLLAMVYLLFQQIAPQIGINWIDVYGAGKVYAGLTLILSIIVVLPMVLDAYFQDVITLRKIVLASLSIRFPTHSKGEGNCRNCHAILEVKEGDICAYCPYCETENLIAINREQLDTIQDFSVWHFKKANEAAAKEQKYKEESRSNLYFWFFGTIVCTVIAAGIGFIFAWSDMEGTPTRAWSELQTHKNELLPAKTEFDSHAYHSIVFGKKYEQISREILAPYYWVALEKGEKLHFKVNEKAYLQGAIIRNSTDFEEARIYQPLEWEKAEEGYHANFTAPYKGKFCLVLHNNIKDNALHIQVTKK